MATIIAILLFCIFLFLSGIHIYWAFDGKWGSGAVLPTKNENDKVIIPGIFPTLLVAFGLLLFGIIALISVIELDFAIHSWIVFLQKKGLWIIIAIFILRAIGDFNYVGYFKKIKHTKFAINDTKYYSPLCLIIGILALTLELIK